MVKKLLLSAFISLMLTLPVSVYGQSIGGWKDYMAYAEISNIEQNGNTIYVLASNNLYTYNKTDKSIQTFDKTNGLSDCEIAYIKWNVSTKRLIIVYTNQNIDIMDGKGNITNLPDYYNKAMTVDKTINSVDMNGQFAYISTGFGVIKINMNQAVISDTYNLGFKVNYTYIEGNYIYAASESQGLYRGLLTNNLLDKNNWEKCGSYVERNEEIDADLLALVKTLKPGGPKYNHFSQMKFKGGKLYTVGGGFSAEADIQLPGMVQVLNGDDWTIYEDEDIEEKTGHLYRATAAVDVDPKDETHVTVGARTGLYEFKNGLLTKHWNATNSSLAEAAGIDYTLVLGVSYDKEGNLWCANSETKNTSLLEYTKEGNWVSHHNAKLMNKEKSLKVMKNLMFDSRNLLWFINEHSNVPALICYQPSTEALVLYKNYINEDGTKLTINNIRCIAEDKDNNIWIGTDVGPIMLEPSYIGKTPEETYFTQVKVPRNDGTNYADYLLTGIDITAIAIDGGGRKWFGTNGNGVYLISENNYEQIHHFLTNNSGLISNNIESIAINDKTGEVYIGTDKGLCSYKSDATEPVDKMNKDNTYAYPNPVRPGYTGLITVTGLTYDADVKIVTANGTLVAKGRSNGGTFTWDGCDLNGKRVASGVYMVETATSEGESGTVCKIAVIN